MRMCACGDTIATLFSVRRPRGRGLDSRIGTSLLFSPLLFFSVSFFPPFFFLHARPATSMLNHFSSLIVGFAHARSANNNNISHNTSLPPPQIYVVGGWDELNQLFQTDIERACVEPGRLTALTDASQLCWQVLLLLVGMLSMPTSHTNLPSFHMSMLNQLLTTYLSMLSIPSGRSGRTPLVNSI